MTRQQARKTLRRHWHGRTYPERVLTRARRLWKPPFPGQPAGAPLQSRRRMREPYDTWARMDLCGEPPSRNLVGTFSCGIWFPPRSRAERRTFRAASWPEWSGERLKKVQGYRTYYGARQAAAAQGATARELRRADAARAAALRDLTAPYHVPALKIRGVSYTTPPRWSAVEVCL